MSLTYTKHEKISLKDNPNFNKKWLQGIISNDPTILGLGDLILKDIERPLSSGRLDLLLKDDETDKRYEVEIQLGKVDESHIIRTIEYWDEERNRYPHYDHIAVIIAEDITSRFLNVIGLFNKAIPIIAIQLNALQLDNNVILNFTKVLDLIQKSDDEIDDNGEPTDRNYWIKKSSEETLNIVDLCVELLKEIWLDKLEEAGITVFRERKSNHIHLRATKDEITKNKNLFIELFKDAYKLTSEE